MFRIALISYLLINSIEVFAQEKNLSIDLSQDIYFSGDKDKWIKAANTLKARFYLHQKDYSSALSAASNGISASSGDMKYKPRGAASQASGDKNLFWTIFLYCLVVSVVACIKP